MKQKGQTQAEMTNYWTVQPDSCINVDLEGIQWSPRTCFRDSTHKQLVKYNDALVAVGSLTPPLLWAKTEKLGRLHSFSAVAPIVKMLFIGKKSLASSIHSSLKPSFWYIFKSYWYFDDFQPGTEAQVSQHIYIYYLYQSLFSKAHQHMLSCKYFSLSWIFSCPEAWPQWMLPCCLAVITARALKSLAL